MSTPKVPVCPVAFEMKELKQRIKHYKVCQDPRCVARREATAAVAQQLAKGVKRS